MEQRFDEFMTLDNWVGPSKLLLTTGRR